MKCYILLIPFFAVGSGLSINTHASRRHAIEGVFAAGIASVISPSEARADISDKAATSAALRNVNRSIKQLDSFELYVVNKQFEELKQAIRVAPLSEIRRNASVLVRAGEDGPDAEALKSSYQSFIRTLEQLDTIATSAVRGREIQQDAFLAKYKDTVASLGEFSLIAEKSIVADGTSD
mmetsp:Transcript_3376/g.5030  ORF Transcript_3376/g.5030 Transcript_3376/m.5030 type:complete len:179 (-) Transcript_3376:1735-2271(-)